MNLKKMIEEIRKAATKIQTETEKLDAQSDTNENSEIQNVIKLQTEKLEEIKNEVHRMENECAEKEKQNEE